MSTRENIRLIARTPYPRQLFLLSQSDFSLERKKKRKERKKAGKKVRIKRMK